MTFDMSLSPTSPLRKAHNKQRYPNLSLPLLVWVALSGTLVASLFVSNLFIFNVSGLVWAATLLVALIILSHRSGKIRFPIFIWLPWIFFLVLYLPSSLATPHSPGVSPIQRSFQLCAPVIIGMALSIYSIRVGVLNKFVDLFKVFLVTLWLLSVLANLSAIISLKTTGLAAQAMTGMLGCIFFLCRYSIYRETRDFLMYFFMATLPILAVTRMAIAVTLVLPNILLAPFSVVKRIVFLAFSAVAGLSVFFLPQVQQKMFYTGSGDLSEVSLDNDQLATSGRSYMWHYLTEFADQKPWFGHGTGQAETFVFNLTGLAYPHNDWLLTYADYGIFGVSIYLSCNLCMILDCWRHGRKVRHPTRKLFFYAGASSFIPFMLMMFTDNIMVYASFFGILQYTIIGLAYGSLNTRKRRPKRKRKALPLGAEGPALNAAEARISSFTRLT